MTAQEWIAAFAAKLGVDGPDQETFDQLLELAAEAAHASKRIAAPIACFLAGSTATEPARALSLARQVAGS